MRRLRHCHHIGRGGRASPTRPARPHQPGARKGPASPSSGTVPPLPQGRRACERSLRPRRFRQAAESAYGHRPCPLLHHRHKFPEKHPAHDHRVPERRLATAHNGNIVNAANIREKLGSVGCSFAATNDTEVISSLIAWEACGGNRLRRRRRRGETAKRRLLPRRPLQPGQADRLPGRDRLPPLCLGKTPRGGRWRPNPAGWTAPGLPSSGISSRGRWSSSAGTVRSRADGPPRPEKRALHL